MLANGNFSPKYKFHKYIGNLKHFLISQSYIDHKLWRKDIYTHMEKHKFQWPLFNCMNIDNSIIFLLQQKELD